MGGRNQSECPAGMDRNRWPESPGISGRNASEYASLNGRLLIAFVLFEKAEDATCGRLDQRAGFFRKIPVEIEIIAADGNEMSRWFGPVKGF
jgi:hypothetical protein